MDTFVGKVEVLPEIDQDRAIGSPLGSYAVKAYNNSTTRFDDVMGVFIISCGYGESVAFKYTKEIHEAGSSVCYWASRDRCQSVVDDFKKINVQAEILEEKS